nr:hypothetical protein [Tanacetum cinerariifolium]
MQTQTLNTLHNAIMEAGGEDRPLMLAPVSEGNPETTTERYMETYKNVSQDIRDQLNAEAEAVQIILTGIDNDIYSTVDACPNACKMWKAIERLKQEWQRFVTLVKQSHELKTVSYHKLYDILKQHQNKVNEQRAERIAQPSMVAEDDEMSKDKEIDKLMALISLSFKKIYKPTNNNLRTSSNTTRANQEFRHVARECQKLKRVKDAAYHREKMLLCKQEEAEIQLNGEQVDWRDDTDDESEDQELEAHYMCMAQIKEVTPDAANEFGPIFDTEPVQKVQNNSNYNVFAIECEHHEQSKSVHDTYPIEQDKHNVIIDSLDMSYDREQIDQNDDDYDLANERKLLASLIEKLKCEIDDNKNRNKLLETSNKVLIVKLKGEIEDFKTKNKSIESSNNRFKEANNKLSETNALMYNDLKKFQAELDRRNDVEYASKDMKAQLQDKGVAIRVIPTTSVSRPQLKSNPMEDRVMLNNSQGKKQEVEEHRRNVKFSKNKTSVTACNDSLNAKTSNVNFVCAICGKCVLNEKHDMCVLKSRNGVNSRTKMPIPVPVSTREPKRTVKQSVAKPIRKTVASESTNPKLRHTNTKLYENVSKTCNWSYPKFTPPGYNWKPKSEIGNVNQNLIDIIRFIVDSGCSKHMTRNLKLLINFVEKFLGTVKFGNDQIAPIIGYGDLVQRDGNDLLTGSYGTDLYSITLQDMSSPNSIFLMAKATSSQAWLWHRRLYHLNFDAINLLLKNDIVIGLPKLKFIKDHLCSSCKLGKPKRKSFQTKSTPSSKRRLQLLHMDLCGPMRVASINEKKYVLVIVDDYSRYTWTHFLRFKDETPEVLINFLRLAQRGLHAQVRTIQTDKGTKFLNKNLHAYFAAEWITHQMSIARTPKQNGVVERRNRTLVEAPQTMLSAAKVPLFF